MSTKPKETVSKITAEPTPHSPKIEESMVSLPQRNPRPLETINSGASAKDFLPAKWPHVKPPLLRAASEPEGLHPKARKQRVESFGGSVTETKSPVQLVVDFLQKLQSRSSLSVQERTEVETLLSLCAHENLWAPASMSFADEASGQNLDPFLQRFIADTLKNPANAPASSGVESGRRLHSRAVAVAQVSGVVNDEKVKELATSSGIQLLEKAHSWLAYDAFEIDKATNKKCLSSLGLFLFKMYEFPTEFQFDLETAARALTKIEASYQENPYHNRWHAADVLQCCHFMLNEGGMRKYFTSLETFALLFSAIVHDADHPGTNNSYQVATHSKLGVRYNDRNVLENHHVATAFKVIWETTSDGDRPHDILAGLNKEDAQEFRKIVIELVLGTDLAVNMEVMNHFKVELEQHKYAAMLGMVKQDEASPEFTPDQLSTPEDRLLLMKMMIKCADIGHVARPLPYHLVWTRNVTKEFYEQGDKERDLGLPVMPFMDRTVGGLAKSQAGFLQFVAKPMWSLIAPFLTTDALMRNIDANLDHWEEQQQRDNSMEIDRQLLASPAVSPAMPRLSPPNPPPLAQALLEHRSEGNMDVEASPSPSPDLTPTTKEDVRVSAQAEAELLLPEDKEWEGTVSVELARADAGSPVSGAL